MEITVGDSPEKDTGGERRIYPRGGLLWVFEDYGRFSSVISARFCQECDSYFRPVSASLGLFYLRVGILLLRVGIFLIVTEC